MGCLWVFSEFFPESFQLLPVALSVAKIKKIPVPVMSPKNFSGMLDGAKILLRPGGHLTGIGDKAIGISAIVAVELFDKVQIGQPSAIEDDEVRPADTRYSVCLEAHGLIEHDPQIEKGKGNVKGVDDGGDKEARDRC